MQRKSSRKCRFIIEWTVLCFTILSTLKDGSRSVAAVASTDGVLDAAMEDAIDFLHVKGASVAFFDQNKQSEPILGGYGKTTSVDSKALDVTPDTVFMVASVSKVITGTAVLVLVDRGIITSLDDDICNVVLKSDEFGSTTSSSSSSACRNPKFPDTPVTWRMLVTHQSSLRGDIPYIETKNGDIVEASYGPTGGYLDGEAAGQGECPMEDVVGFYRDFLIDKPTETVVGADLGINWYKVGQAAGGAWNDFKPGSQTEYSNLAVGYIAALVELASGETFPDFCANYIFEPLGMNNTAWFRRDLPESVEEAVPVEHIRRNRFNEVGHYCFIDYASGSLRTSARDMSKFLHAMITDYGDDILFSRGSGLGLQALTCQEVGVDKEGRALHNGCEFGVNWIVYNNSTKDSRLVEFWIDPLLGLDWTNGGAHDGAEVGCQTQILVLPEAGVYALVFTNTDGNDDWAAQEMMYDMFEALGYSSSPRFHCTLVLSLGCLLLIAFLVMIL